MELNKFEFYDLWLLLSIGTSSKGSNMKQILSKGDYLNHARFNLDELNNGMSKLIYNGFAEEVDNGRYKLTEKATEFYKENRIEKEGSIDEMFRLSEIFQKIVAKKGCKYKEYFSKAEYEKRGKSKIIAFAKRVGLYD